MNNNNKLTKLPTQKYTISHDAVLTLLKNLRATKPSTVWVLYKNPNRAGNVLCNTEKNFKITVAPEDRELYYISTIPKVAYTVLAAWTEKKLTQKEAHLILHTEITRMLGKL